MTERPSVRALRPPESHHTRDVLCRAVLDYVIDVCFLVDLCLNFRTAVQTVEGVVDVTPSGIMWNYLKGWFTIDLLSTFPFVRRRA